MPRFSVRSSLALALPSPKVQSRTPRLPPPPPPRPFGPYGFKAWLDVQSGSYMGYGESMEIAKEVEKACRVREPNREACKDVNLAMVPYTRMKPSCIFFLAKDGTRQVIKSF